MDNKMEKRSARQGGGQRAFKSELPLTDSNI